MTGVNRCDEAAFGDGQERSDELGCTVARQPTSWGPKAEESRTIELGKKICQRKYRLTGGKQERIMEEKKKGAGDGRRGLAGG